MKQEIPAHSFGVLIHTFSGRVETCYSLNAEF